MELKAWINGEDYNIVLGPGQEDNLNETLDSATIIIPHANNDLGIKPYDDVWIHSADYDISNKPRFKTLATYNEAATLGKIYHHYLIGNLSRERIYLNGSYFTYTISLVSEAKGLETCLMPNRTITQPKDVPISMKDHKIEENSRHTSGTVLNDTDHYEVDFTMAVNKDILISSLKCVISTDDHSWAGSTCSYADGVLSFHVETDNPSCPFTMYIEYTLNKYSSVRSCLDVIKEYIDEYSTKVRVQEFGHVFNKSLSGTYGYLADNFTVTFHNIPSDYTDLEITHTSTDNRIRSISVKSFSSGNLVLKVQLNASYITSTNYTVNISYKAASVLLWKWTSKYSLDPNLENIFGSILAPETQFSAPTLRSALQQLFLVKDCLPIVKDGVICALDISQRGNLFTTIPGASWDQYTMDMSSYSDRLRRTYSNALSEKNTARFVEKMGFRNSESSTMTLENMRLEFSHPIYKIKSLKLCSYFRSSSVGGKVTLFKFDITPLILLSSIRNLLSEDWDTLNNNPPKTFEEMAKYKICTIGYNIGSRFISGWGEKYSYPTGWLAAESSKTILENILVFVQNNYRNIVSKVQVYSYADNNSNYITLEKDIGDGYMVAPGNNPSWLPAALEAFVSDFSQKLKTLFFEVEYDGFIDGTVIIAKDLHDGNVVMNDNTASSLTIVEKDGLFEKEKANRLGNAARVVSARVSSLSDILNLGDYNSDDEIIYKIVRNYEKDYISVSYYLCKDYVLKNYYTSVWAKNRPFALASYGESTQRNENRYECIVLSKDKSYYQNDSTQIFHSGNFFYSVVSFYKPTVTDGVNFYNQYEINSSSINIKEGKEYLTDTQCFTVGNSLCFDVIMNDNITSGVYINTLSPTFGSHIQTVLENLGGLTIARTDAIAEGTKCLGDISGSTQNWYWISNDIYSGYAANMDFIVSSVSQSDKNNVFYSNPLDDYNYDQDKLYKMSGGKVIGGIFSKILSLPLNPYSEKNFKLKATTKYKDGKECINMIVQLDAIPDTEDIKIGNNFLGMSDLNPNARKYDGDVTANPFLLSTIARHNDSTESSNRKGDVPTFTLYFPLNKVQENIQLNAVLNWKSKSGWIHSGDTWGEYNPVEIRLTLKKIITVNADSIVVEVQSWTKNNNYDFREGNQITNTFNMTMYNQRKYTRGEMLNFLTGNSSDNITWYPSGIIEDYDSFTGNIPTIKIINNSGEEEDYKFGLRYIYTQQTLSTQYLTRDYITIPYVNSGSQRTNSEFICIEDSYNNPRCVRYDFSNIAQSVVKNKNIMWYACYNKMPSIGIPETAPETGEYDPNVVFAPKVKYENDGRPYLELAPLFENNTSGYTQIKSIQCFINGEFTFGVNNNPLVLSANKSAYNYVLNLEPMNVSEKNTYLATDKTYKIQVPRKSGFVYNSVSTIVDVKEGYVSVLNTSFDSETYILTINVSFGSLLRRQNNRATISINVSYYSTNEYYSSSSKIYLSLLDTRSKSVINAITGDVIGKITNYCDSTKTYGIQNDYDIITDEEE